MQAHAHTCMHTYTHIHTHIYIFLRSTPLDSLAEQPAVAPTFLRPQRGSRAQIASKLLSIFTSPTGHPDGGGRIDICRRPHLQSDSAIGHIRRESFPRQNLKVFDRIVERGTTEKLDQLGFCLPKGLGARIRRSARETEPLWAWLVEDWQDPAEHIRLQEPP